MVICDSSSRKLLQGHSTIKARRGHISPRSAREDRTTEPFEGQGCNWTSRTTKTQDPNSARTLHLSPLLHRLTLTRGFLHLRETWLLIFPEFPFDGLNYLRQTNFLSHFQILWQEPTFQISFVPISELIYQD